MNPFELRVNLLNMAKDMLENQYHAQTQAWETMEKFADSIPHPKFPTFEEILERAKEMNKFISDSK